MQLGARKPTDAIEAHEHEMPATHNSFRRHDQARAVAAAQILMRMRHGPPDTAAIVRRHERRDKVSITIGANVTGGKQHIHLRWTATANGRNVKIHIEATRKTRTADRPYTS